jgi:glycosyltransferase involved in cell wall biosynthesis
LEVLFVGRLAWRKGVFEALEASKQVLQEMPNVRFTFAGYGPLERKAREYVAAHGLVEQVHLLGAIKDRKRIVELQQRSRVVLVPSYYEGCPFSLLEAMASGRAIVSTTGAFTKGLIEHYVTGKLVEPKQSKPLAAAIMELLRDYELCRRLGAAVRRRAEVLMESESNTDQFEAAYRTAIERFNRRS